MELQITQDKQWPYPSSYSHICLPPVYWSHYQNTTGLLLESVSFWALKTPSTDDQIMKTTGGAREMAKYAMVQDCPFLLYLPTL